MVPLNVLLRQIVLGGFGTSPYGILRFVMLTVFLAAPLACRAPEYLGRKIEARSKGNIGLSRLYKGAVARLLAAQGAALPRPLRNLGASATTSDGAQARADKPGRHTMTDLSALDGARWLNTPPVWDRTNGAFSIETGERTDFWRDTLYGFRRDNGHALLAPADGDVTAHVEFDGAYQALYDQAGLMLRQDEAHWIKAGVEFSDGVANLSVVVTRQASDWSTVALPGQIGPQRLRLTRRGGAVVIQARNTANRWQLLRVAPFPEGPAMIGPMACSPERAGFRARFSAFTLGPAVAQPLHDDSPAA